MMDGWGWMAGGFWLWLILSVVVIAGVVALVVALVRATTPKDSSPPPSAPHEDSPREILDARYARGELDRDAYLQARRDLGDPPD